MHYMLQYDTAQPAPPGEVWARLAPAGTATAYR